MLNEIAFCICIVLQYHYRDNIPWFIWALAILMSISDNVIKVKGDKSSE